MIKSVIFDLYGTLLELSQDSKPFLNLAQSSSAISLGDALRIALTNHCPSLRDCATQLNLMLESDLDILEKNLHNDLERVRLYTDVIPTLKVLATSNIKIAVISNLATPYKLPFSRHQLESYFDVTVFSCDCGLMKPDPAIYKMALHKLDTLPHETIMVGDSLKSDVEGPSRVGIVSYHLKRTGNITDPLTELSTLEAIPKIVSDSSSKR
ncbi:HAD family hydrolase [Gimesia sp.]|uniref:HAD family hydrolase n=1 Tax=Gimesia sp. TaxID=2024833 RepID=UPI000C6A2C9A|nr:HAD family hydrolase [Gimesia sp.]MAX37721.1 hypothetical protein [Gimesia sp.]HAH43689.1 hypothetical protein [Planctomycetaceae bacterium]HBL46181.1 hypothetical protein [Planctomycetaceae bacterium]|tara:strand:- start:6094 stop:6723 length:630 start_codon:yes stop_codon:yes gene_type:complete